MYDFGPEKTLGKQRAVKKSEFFIKGSGEIRRGPLGDDEVIEKGGLSHILVEISIGNEIKRRRNDEEDRFSFERIRPGTLLMKVYKRDLPLHHYLEKEEYQIELIKGE